MARESAEMAVATAARKPAGPRRTAELGAGVLGLFVFGFTTCGAGKQPGMPELRAIKSESTVIEYFLSGSQRYLKCAGSRIGESFWIRRISHEAGSSHAAKGTISK